MKQSKLFIIILLDFCAISTSNLVVDFVQFCKIVTGNSRWIVDCVSLWELRRSAEMWAKDFTDLNIQMKLSVENICYASFRLW